MDVRFDNNSLVHFHFCLCCRRGPHSQFTTCYMAPYAYMALTLNMAVLMVNYRGSTVSGLMTCQAACPVDAVLIGR
mgnify:CR=1